MNKKISTLLLFAISFMTSNVRAATDWSVQDYDLYPGDFNGDGKSDVLYIAKSPDKPSGIAISDLSNGPNTSWQTWQSNYLGLQWYGNRYTAVVGDYNGDGKSDVFLQSNVPGDSLILITDANGRITGISQSFSSCRGLVWSGDQHKVFAGRFTGRTNAVTQQPIVEFFLQAVTPTGLNAVIKTHQQSSASDMGGGQIDGCSSASADQSWIDGAVSTFKWSTKDSVITAGDYDGDGLTDLLLQSKAKFVTIDFDVPFTVPFYPPGSFGIAFSVGGGTPFISTSVQPWNRISNGVDWAPEFYNAVAGNFIGTSRMEILLQAKSPTRVSNLVVRNADNTFGISSTVGAGGGGPSISADSAKLFAANFDGNATPTVGLYIQSTSASGTNYFSNSVTASTTTSAHSPTSINGVVPATAVGATSGAFEVSSTGSATYRIPIVVPPGIKEVKPNLSLSYSSQYGNGLLGMGWVISGLSRIEYCTGQTYVLYCLDGNKLVPKDYNSNDPQPNSSYSTFFTELQTYSLITLHGSGASTYFTVQGKDGLTYQYGGSSSDPYQWPLTSVSDRVGNTMTYTYQPGSTRLMQVDYTSNTTAGLPAAYSVKFIWESRPPTDYVWDYRPNSVYVGYGPGGKWGVQPEAYRLNRIETYANSSLVRTYNLSYQLGASLRSQLIAIQECAGGACLAPTQFTWQVGNSSYGSEATVSASGLDATAQSLSYAMDYDGDGRTDLVYPRGTGSTHFWSRISANGSGFDAQEDLTSAAGDNNDVSNALPVPQNASGSAVGLMTNKPLQQDTYFNNCYRPIWAIFSTSTLSSAIANATCAIPEQVNDRYWSGDFDGNGTTDILYATGNSGNFHLRPSIISNANSPYPAPYVYAPAYNPYISTQRAGSQTSIDFNGDRKSDIVAEWAGLGNYCDADGGCVQATAWTWNALMSTGSGLNVVASGMSGGCDVAAGFYCSPHMEVYVGDFNGDGISDILGGTIVGSTPQWQVRFGSTNGLGSPINVSLPIQITNGVTADFDASGRAQLLYNDGSWRIARWNDTQQAFDLTATDIIPADATNIRIMDINGDGLTDVGYSRAGSFTVRMHNGPAPDVMSSVTDGFGNQVGITYTYSTDPSVYSEESPSTASPYEREYAAPWPIVKEFRKTDGIGDLYTVAEHYTGSRRNGSRGFLGFTQRDETDTRTGITRHLDFLINGSLGFPFSGRVAHERITQGDANKTSISDTTYEYDQLISTSGAVTFPYLKKTTRKTYEVDGTQNGLLREEQTTTVNAIDSYGNATDVTTDIADKDSQQLLPSTQRSYSTRVVQRMVTDESNWCVGLADRTTTTTTLGDGTSRSQRASRTIDNGYCRVTDELTFVDAQFQPTSHSVLSHLDFNAAACGNPSAVTVTGRRTDNTTLAPRTTSFGYATSACIAPSTITDPYGKVVDRQYNSAFGVLTYEKDATSLPSDTTNKAMQWGYDSFGRRTSETRKDGTSTVLAFAACNVGNSYCGVSNLRSRIDTTVRDASGAAMRTSYTYLDSLGRVRIEDSPLPIDGTLSHVVTTYDTFGRVATRSVPYTSAYQGGTVNDYDLVGRLKSTKLYDGSGVLKRQSSVRYEGRRNVFTDPRGNITDKIVDVSGQTRQVFDDQTARTAACGAGPTCYSDTFSGDDLLSTIKDPVGNQIVVRTNIAGQKIRSSDPDMGIWDFEYTSLGELTKQTDAKHQETSFDDYDLLGRPTKRHEPEGDTDFTYGTQTYHSYGMLTSISSGGYSEAYDFDAAGHQVATHIVIPSDTTYHAYYNYQPATGLLDTVTYPTSTGSYPLKLKYGYNSRGVQTTVTDYTNNVLASTPYWQLTATNASGQSTTEELGNGVHVRSGYDLTTGLITSRQSGTDTGGYNQQNLVYEWDVAGNLHRRTDNNQAGLFEEFTYDLLNRLSYSQLNNNTTNLQMVYDAIGNITYKTGPGTYTYPLAGAARPHAVSTTNLGNYGYDDNGNMTSKPGATISWYSDNSVKKITQGSVSSEFWYGPNGNRYKQQAVYSSGNEATYYVGGLMDKVVLASGTAYRHYINAGSSSIVLTRWSTGTTQYNYVTTDHLGSSGVITNGSGTIVVKENFDAFGLRRGNNWTGSPTSGDMQAIANATRDGYTGHEHLDNLGLIHMNGRVQDPTLGRFLSADPTVQAPEFSQSLNRYSYVWNNPLTMTDPSGFEGTTCIGGGKVTAAGGGDAKCDEVIVTGERQFGPQHDWQPISANDINGDSGRYIVPEMMFPTPLVGHDLKVYLLNPAEMEQARLYLASVKPQQAQKPNGSHKEYFGRLFSRSGKTYDGRPHPTKDNNICYGSEAQCASPAATSNKPNSQNQNSGPHKLSAGDGDTFDFNAHLHPGSDSNSRLFSNEDMSLSKNYLMDVYIGNMHGDFLVFPSGMEPNSSNRGILVCGGCIQ